MDFDKTFEIVFFPCKDIEKQDRRVLDIVERDKDVIVKKEAYRGEFPNKSKKSLNPDNIEEVDGKFVVKDPSKTFTDYEWYWIKRLKKIRRNMQQNEENLRAIGFWPVFNIQKEEGLREEVLWNSDLLKTNLDDNTGLPCDHMAFMIDRTKNLLAGIAKGTVIHPEVEPNDFPRGSSIIPLDREYVYISDVNIHPYYRGKGLCKPFLKRFMNKFTQLPERYESFYIENASDIAEGIPACLCYVKAGQEDGFDMFYFTRHKNTVKAMSTDTCFFSEDTAFELPTSYFYIKPTPKTGGSRKKRKTYKKSKAKIRKAKKGKTKKSKKLNGRRS
jgi:hypothetical protein